MPTDAIIEAYIRNNAIAEEIVLSADEIKGSIEMMKAEMTSEQLTYLTRNTAEPT